MILILNECKQSKNSFIIQKSTVNKGIKIIDNLMLTSYAFILFEVCNLKPKSLEFIASYYQCFINLFMRIVLYSSIVMGDIELTFRIYFYLFFVYLTLKLCII